MYYSIEAQTLRNRLISSYRPSHWRQVDNPCEVFAQQRRERAETSEQLYEIFSQHGQGDDSRDWAVAEMLFLGRKYRGREGVVREEIVIDGHNAFGRSNGSTPSLDFFRFI